MIILNKHQQRRPFGGHHYPEMGIVVRAESFDELVGKVGKLRLMNGHPMGDPEKDILRYYVEHFPYMVKEGEGHIEPMKPSDYSKYRDWIRYLWYDPPKRLQTVKQPRLRWDKCKACPRNAKKDWKETEESAEFARRAFMLRCGIDVPSFLGFCSCFQWDLGVAVFLDAPEKYSNKRKGDSPPPECWLSDGR